MTTHGGPSKDTLVTEWTWKTPEMRDMAIAVCRLALARGIGGQFSAVDLPEHGAEAHGGTGIAGSIFRVLTDAGILSPVGTFADGEFLQRRVRNAGGNWIGVWRLRNAGLATALIAKHAATPTPHMRQMDLIESVYGSESRT